MPKSWIFVAKKFPSYTPQGVVLNLSPQLIRCWTIAQKSCSRGKECSKSQWEPLQTKAKTGAFSRFKYLLDFQAYLEGWTPQKLWVQKLNRNQNRAPQQCLVLHWLQDSSCVLAVVIFFMVSMIWGWVSRLTSWRMARRSRPWLMRRPKGTFRGNWNHPPDYLYHLGGCKNYLSSKLSKYHYEISLCF